ncbi:hypothetical protein [Belnapia moabensis]|uniref:hypothetical protein n=1 Tax=Belnapia moabensis TaxID=365533 RepID=UPI0005BD8B35|nr:hypothetical protein [Belnapia moabensis]
MLLMSRLRQAARDADCLSFAYGGGDVPELIALLWQIANRERCTMEYAVVSGTPGIITVRFQRQGAAVSSVVAR